VVNWVNSDRLRAHRTPGGHRRITKADLVSFAKEYNYPLSEELLGERSEQTRVLVVDDEHDFSDMVRDYLSLRGKMEVEVADSGFAAGFTVARFKPDVILMDIMMPDMNGFEVVRMLRGSKDTAHIPVIACTAFLDAQVERRIQEEEFDGLVQKPIKLDELLSLIRSTLNPEDAR
jgi:CheY-like chemotaxis protein